MSEPETRSTESPEAILDAAERLFAKSGFAATTIKAIARAAGVNSALLYYYFADKEALYRAVLEREMRLLAAEGMRRIQQTQSPPEAVRALIEAQLGVLLARPHLPRLVVRELVDHEASHAEPVIAKVMAGLFSRICETIRAGQREGVFRAEVEPRYAAVSIVSQLVYFFVARPAVAILLGKERDGLPDDYAREFGQHAVDFALAALATRETINKEHSL
jgi:AcrR family transcriptional regulator